jgi:hypothetical protein
MAQHVCSITPVSAQEQRTEIGLLTCGLAKSTDPHSSPDTTLRQTREVLCAFRPAGNGPEETYTGTLQGAGPDVGFPDGKVMMWIVAGTSGMVGPPGMLQQVYAAELAANPGQSPRLIGETNMSIVLRTLADEHAPAVADKVPQGAAAIVVLITLTLASTPA